MNEGRESRTKEERLGQHEFEFQWDSNWEYLQKIRYPQLCPQNYMLLKVRGLNVIKNITIPLMSLKNEKRIKEDFGKGLRDFRKSKGFSQETLALACDLDRTYIGSVERGERNISLINIVKISEALGISAYELLKMGTK